ncbi:hypothetical protein KM472_gp271 [Cynomolgus macaque cytomegalovirus strain Ottawa]|uniref:Uncharacterized protein n=2 Tax=Cytomegalovirus TaxID=10358 RepID=G8H100_9BETA|nr:hypothetical protein KM472_gp271 [Cynomolgus macaque cytomegalovirus strain Ottawa]AEQ32348.1 hypothetical protein cy259 [Cynomolgus macaque cytomegalovirus strain Ottawa]AKT72904.1 hypothetical protein [Cynomolgus macaque cytomegalovirus strain Mauritius]AXG21962.1 hypothetical protein [synthetic construct]AXG22232.1 hypothetical protein [synthetic construct]
MAFPPIPSPSTRAFHVQTQAAREYQRSHSCVAIECSTCASISTTRMCFRLIHPMMTLTIRMTSL